MQLRNTSVCALGTRPLQGPRRQTRAEGDGPKHRKHLRGSERGRGRGSGKGPSRGRTTGSPRGPSGRVPAGRGAKVRGSSVFQEPTHLLSAHRPPKLGPAVLQTACGLAGRLLAGSSNGGAGREAEGAEGPDPPGRFLPAPASPERHPSQASGAQQRRCLPEAAGSPVYSLPTSCKSSLRTAPRRACLLSEVQGSALWGPSKFPSFSGFSLCSLSPKGSTCVLWLLPHDTIGYSCMPFQ